LLTPLSTSVILLSKRNPTTPTQKFYRLESFTNLLHLYPPHRKYLDFRYELYLLPRSVQGSLDRSDTQVVPYSTFETPNLHAPGVIEKNPQLISFSKQYRHHGQVSTFLSHNPSNNSKTICCAFKMSKNELG